MIPSLNYTGRADKSPYEFAHHDVSEIGLQVNSTPVPMIPYTSSYATKNWIMEYMMLYLALGKAGVHSDDHSIAFDDFPKSYCLYAFNFAPDLALSGHCQAARLSNIHLDMRFSKPTPTDKTLTLLVFAIYDTKFELAADGKILTDSTQQN